jgi:hypothetical protein
MVPRCKGLNRPEGVSVSRVCVCGLSNNPPTLLIQRETCTNETRYYGIRITMCYDLCPNIRDHAGSMCKLLSPISLFGPRSRRCAIAVRMWLYEFVP